MFNRRRVRLECQNTASSTPPTSSMQIMPCASLSKFRALLISMLCQLISAKVRLTTLGRKRRACSQAAPSSARYRAWPLTVDHRACCQSPGLINDLGFRGQPSKLAAALADCAGRAPHRRRQRGCALYARRRWHLLSAGGDRLRDHGGPDGNLWASSDRRREDRSRDRNRGRDPDRRAMRRPRDHHRPRRQHLDHRKQHPRQRIEPANPGVGQDLNPIATANAKGMTTGSDGLLWFADGDKIFSATAADTPVLTPYAVGGTTQDVAAGPNAQVAYANPGSSPQSVGRIPPAARRRSPTSSPATPSEWCSARTRPTGSRVRTPTTCCG